MSNASINRHIALLEEKGEKYVLKYNKVYRIYKNVIRPYGPISDNYDLSDEDSKDVLNILKKKAIILTNGFSENNSGYWYATISNKFISIDDMKSKIRNEFNKSLKNCLVVQLESKWVAQNAYEVYRDAFSRYKSNSNNIWSLSEFKKHFIIYEKYTDIVECWGVFINNNLAGFAVTNLFDNEEVTYWMIKVSPKYLQQLPVYALIYSMNYNYLEKNKYRYVNDGWRSIAHETGIQSFLEKKFGFCKQNSRLKIKYSKDLELLIKSLYFFKKPILRTLPQLKPIIELEEIRRKDEKYII